MTRVLLVAEEEESRRLHAILGQAGHSDLLEVPSFPVAYALLQAQDPARPVGLILMDLSSPGTEGLEACRRLTEDRRFRAIPLVVLAGAGDRKTLEAVLDLGAANDFLPKPVDPELLLLRVDAALNAPRPRGLVAEVERPEARLRWEEARLASRERLLLEARRELEKAGRELEHLSVRDPLTGVANRRLFTERLAHEWRRAIRSSSPLGLVVLDLDLFKGFNDARGHAAGNECLKRIAGALHASLPRPGDLLARYGGEEFAALLPATDGAGARRVAERLRHVVESLGIPHPRSAAGPKVTVSGGAACLLPSSALSPSNLLEEAEKALHLAKAGGRNCVLLANGAFQGAPPATRF